MKKHAVSTCFAIAFVCVLSGVWTMTFEDAEGMRWFVTGFVFVAAAAIMDCT